MQFASLMTLLDVWRSEGFGADQLEVWSITWTSFGYAAEEFADGSEEPCFESPSFNVTFDLYDAEVNEIFLVDRQGRIRYEMSFATTPLTDPATGALFDSLVRELLAE